MCYLDPPKFYVNNQCCKCVLYKHLLCTDMMFTSLPNNVFQITIFSFLDKFLLTCIAIYILLVLLLNQVKKSEKIRKEVIRSRNSKMDSQYNCQKKKVKKTKKSRQNTTQTTRLRNTNHTRNSDIAQIDTSLYLLGNQYAFASLFTKEKSKLNSPHSCFREQTRYTMNWEHFDQ